MANQLISRSISLSASVLFLQVISMDVQYTNDVFFFKQKQLIWRKWQVPPITPSLWIVLRSLPQWCPPSLWGPPRLFLSLTKMSPLALCSPLPSPYSRPPSATQGGLRPTAPFTPASCPSRPPTSPRTSRAPWAVAPCCRRWMASPTDRGLTSSVKMTPGKMFWKPTKWPFNAFKNCQRRGFTALPGNKTTSHRAWNLVNHTIA